MPSKFFHVGANGKILFLFMAEAYSVVYIHIFIYSSVVGHVGSFHILAIVNNATLNIGGYCLILEMNKLH